MHLLSRVQDLVSLLLALQSLDTLLMHLLGHLFVTLLLFLLRPLVSNGLDTLLQVTNMLATNPSLSRVQWFEHA